MTALMVCSRFSAWSNTMEAGDSKTSSVTSRASRPCFPQLADVPLGQPGQLQAGPVHDDLAELADL